MSIYNERLKLLATALNNAAVSTFTVGVAAPLAAVFYDFGSVHVAALWVAIGIATWMGAAIALHFGARHIMGGLDDA